jgi:hypothetical protein
MIGRNGQHYLAMSGGLVEGGNNSGRIWGGGSFNGDHITPLPITAATHNLPLQWRYATDGNEPRDVSVYITTSSSSYPISGQGGGQPVTATITEQKSFSSVSFTNKTASVNWDEGN